MLCKKCGAEIPDNAEMCEYCGAQLTNDTVQSVNEDAEQTIYDANEKNRQNQIDKMLEEKEVQLSQIQQRRDSKKAKQRRLKLAIIACSCILAAAALGGGGYYIYNAVSLETVQVTPTPAPTMRLTTAIPVTPIPSAAILPSASPAVAAAATPGNWTSSNSGTSANKSSSGGTSTSANKPSSGGGTSASANKPSSNSGTSASKPSSGGSASTGGTSSRDSGVTTNVISSQMAVGSEVINEGDKWYMTFTSGGIKYYAHVNPGATTDQVRNKNYTLNAEPTSETYNGNTVYEITSMTKYDGQGYILRDSGTRLLTKSDLSGLSRNDLALARNEIYARYGRRFTTPAYQRYFETKSWYSENPNYNYDDDNANLNEIEIKNVQLIIDCER